MRAVLTLATAVLVLLQGDALCRDTFVAPVRDSIGVYANPTRKLSERPQHRVGTHSRLVLLERVGDNLKVRDTDGRIGWVESRQVVRISTAAMFHFGDEKVLGWLDDLSITMIIDGFGPGETPIFLDRTFSDALRENEDRDTMERATTAH